MCSVCVLCEVIAIEIAAIHCILLPMYTVYSICLHTVLRFSFIRHCRVSFAHTSFHARTQTTYLCVYYFAITTNAVALKLNETILHK